MPRGDVNLQNLLVGGAASRPNSISGLQADFRDRLYALIRDAPGAVFITSGYRSHAAQARLYNAWVAGGRRGAPVAPPGHSNHGRGTAVDLSVGSGLMGGNSATARWIHAHAADYGLRFPMGNEPWHIQPIANWSGTVPHYNDPTNVGQGSQAPMANYTGPTGISPTPAPVPPQPNFYTQLPGGAGRLTQESIQQATEALGMGGPSQSPYGYSMEMSAPDPNADYSSVPLAASNWSLNPALTGINPTDLQSGMFYSNPDFGLYNSSDIAAGGADINWGAPLPSSEGLNIGYPGGGPSAMQLPPDVNPFGPSPGDWSPGGSVFNPSQTGGIGGQPEPQPGETPSTFDPSRMGTGPSSVGSLSGNDFTGGVNNFSMPDVQRQDPGFYDFSALAGPGAYAGGISQGGNGITGFGGDMSLGPSFGGGADMSTLYPPASDYGATSGNYWPADQGLTGPSGTPFSPLQSEPLSSEGNGITGFGGNFSLGSDLNSQFGNYWTDPSSGETHVYDQNWTWLYSVPADAAETAASTPAGPSGYTSASDPGNPYATTPFPAPLPPMYSNGITPIYNLPTGPTQAQINAARELIGQMGDAAAAGGYQGGPSMGGFYTDPLGYGFGIYGGNQIGTGGGLLNAQGYAFSGPSAGPDMGSPGPNSQMGLVRYL